MNDDQYNIILETDIDAQNASDDITNWTDVQVNVGRNLNYLGVFRKYSTAYIFAKKSASFLRNIFYTNGNNGKVKIRVEKLVSTDRTYSPFIYTDLDFSKGIDSRDTFTVSAMESDATGKVNAYKNTVVQIPIDGPEVVQVAIPHRLIEGEIRYVTGWPIPIQIGNPSPFNTIGGTIYYINTASTMIVAESTSGPVDPVTPTTQQYAGYPTSGTWSPSFDGLLRANADIYEVKAIGELRLYLENTSGTAWNYFVRFQKIPAGSNVATTLVLLASGAVQAHSDISLVLNINAGSYTLAKDDRLILTFFVSGPNGSCNAAWEPDSAFKITFKNYSPGFKVSGLRVGEVFKRICANWGLTVASDLMNDQNASYIDGVDNRPYDTIITSGDSIRQIATSGSDVAVIKITLDKFFKSTNVWWNTGLSIENEVVRIEKKSRFYDSSTTTFDFGDSISDCEISAATDLLFNKVTIGYESQDYDGLNGRDEFNTTQSYSSDVTTSTTELELISPIRADGFGIHNTYVKYSSTTTTDSKSDNSVFAIEISSAVVGGQYVPLHLPGTYSGAIDPVNAYNWGLSPKRCLIRHGSYLRACLFGIENSLLTWQNTDKNADLESSLSFGIVDESADVFINTLNPPLFQPFNISTGAASRANVLTAMDQKPYGVININLRGVDIAGFIFDGGNKPAFPEKYTFKLLSSPLNNLNLLA